MLTVLVLLLLDTPCCTPPPTSDLYVERKFAVPIFEV